MKDRIKSVVGMSAWLSIIFCVALFASSGVKADVPAAVESYPEANPRVRIEQFCRGAVFNLALWAGEKIDAGSTADAVIAEADADYAASVKAGQADSDYDMGPVRSMIRSISEADRETFAASFDVLVQDCIERKL